MSPQVKIHPIHKFKISPSTGKRLPSRNFLIKAISVAEAKLALLRTQLQEHLLEVSK